MAIKSIEINNGQSYKIGEQIIITGGELKGDYEISQIDDNSRDFENSYHSEFAVYATTEKNVQIIWARIINLPIVINYFY